MYVPCVFNYSRKMYMYIYLEGSCSNVAVMSRIQQFSNRKKCRGNEHLISRRNVAVMSCKFLQCRGNVFLPSIQHYVIKFVTDL